MNLFNFASEVQLSPCRRNLFAFAALLIIILSIYSNTFDASWHFDDGENIQARSAIHLTQVNWPEIKRTFFFEKGESKGKLYRPVVNFTFAVNYYFGKLDVFGYHMVNISVHIVTSIFLFLFIYYTLNLPLLKPGYGSSAYFIALLATVFWAINPVQTQAITYIVQRMASMAAMFYIMSMYFFLKGRTSQNRSRKGLFFILCFLSGILAVGSKENAAMLPISILLFDFLVIQGVTKESIRKNIRILFLLIFIPLIFAMIFKGASIFDPDQVLKPYDTTRPFSLVERLLTEPRIILFYISLLLYPMPYRLSLSHDMAISSSLIDPATTIIAILVIMAVLAACIIKSTRWPFITYCILFFFVNHIIEGSIFGLELIFEHRNYLPSMLLFVPLAILFAKSISYYSNRRVMQVVIYVFIILLLVGFGNSTFVRNFDWKTDGTLWNDAADKAPDIIRPHINLGCYYLSHNMLEKALSEFSLATSSKILSNLTDRGVSIYNVGLIHQRLGNSSLALEYYRKSAKVFPSHSDTHNNMGLILAEREEIEEAEQEYLLALRFGKNSNKPYKNISLLMLKQGRVKEAIRYLHLALRRWPHNMNFLGLAGYAHRLRGEYGSAFMFLELALAIEFHDPKLNLYMSEIYFKRGMNKEAEELIQRFIEREKGGDLLIYLEGITKEEDIDMIQPYKKMVLQSLAQVYKKRADLLVEKASSLTGEIFED